MAERRKDASAYEIGWGSSDTVQQRRYFSDFRMTDAVLRISERIVELDRAPAKAAFAYLKMLPDAFDQHGRTLISWTKTSDERPTDEGTTEIKQ